MIDYYPYDAATPHRPSLDDLGGDQKLDDETALPGAGEPRAAEWNNFVRLHEAVARMLPLASLTIAFNAGVPYVSAATSMRTTIAASDFTITDNGVGDTTIEWGAALLPSVSRRPKVTPHAAVIVSHTEPTALSVRVVTVNHANAATDGSFTLDIY